MASISFIILLLFSWSKYYWPALVETNYNNIVLVFHQVFQIETPPNYKSFAHALITHLLSVASTWHRSRLLWSKWSKKFWELYVWKNCVVIATIKCYFAGMIKHSYWFDQLNILKWNSRIPMLQYRSPAKLASKMFPCRELNPGRLGENQKS